MPDAVQAPEEPTPVKQPKSPSTYVLQLVDGAWKHLTERAAVKATNRKKAIAKATERLEEKGGTFVAVKEGEFVPITRKLEQKIEDVWG